MTVCLPFPRAVAGVLVPASVSARPVPPAVAFSGSRYAPTSMGYYLSLVKASYPYVNESHSGLVAGSLPAKSAHGSILSRLVATIWA